MNASSSVDRRAELLRRLRETRDRFGALRDLSGDKLALSYGPGKWNVRQIVAHLADSETINLCRFMRAAAMTGGPVLVYHENDFASRLHYDERPASLSIQLFMSARLMLEHYVMTFGDEEMAREAVHPEKGRVSCERWAELAASHSAHHLGQIDCALRGEPWTFVDTPGSWQYRGMSKPADG